MKSYLMITTDGREEDLDYPLSKFDLTPGAVHKRHYVDGWTIKSLAYHYNTTETFIKRMLDIFATELMNWNRNDTKELNKMLAEKSIKNHLTQITGKYQNNYTDVEITCECGHKEMRTFASMSNNIRYYDGVFVCSNADNHGEKLVEDYLKEHNYSYNSQQTFKNLIDKLLLRFDFSIIENEKIKYVIEHDGKYHNRNDRKLSKQHDDLKNEYCKENNIPLLRIDNYENIGKQIREFERLNFY